MTHILNFTLYTIKGGRTGAPERTGKVSPKRRSGNERISDVIGRGFCQLCLYLQCFTTRILLEREGQYGVEPDRDNMVSQFYRNSFAADRGRRCYWNELDSSVLLSCHADTARYQLS